MQTYFTIRWIDGKVRMLDQRLLPHQVQYVDCDTPLSVANAIREMVIRGAPAIGVAAAYGMALAAYSSPARDADTLIADLEKAGEVLKNARPTAVNLAWAVDRLMGEIVKKQIRNPDMIRTFVLQESQRIAQEDVVTNRQMGQHALEVIPKEANIIHHCNTGSLATVEYGTALGAIRAAHESGRNVHVYVDETRPRLQGARLTAWELTQLGIPFTLICDSASGFFMRQGKIDLCLVGCDRVAANGDTANKIGTYNLAIVAKAHSVPFYIVGPTSTVDLNLRSGTQIPIEERSATEITTINGSMVPPEGVKVANPAFDVTPARLITGIITERGIAYPPYEQSLARLCSM